MDFSFLPSLVALAILVVVFWSILRQVPSEGLNLWLIGWILVLIHFVAQFVATVWGSWEHLAAAVHYNALLLATVAFLISVWPTATTHRRQLLVAVFLGLPALLYTDAIVWRVSAPALYYALASLGFVALVLITRRFHQSLWAYVNPIRIAAFLVSAFVIWNIAHGRPEVGVVAILAAFNFAAASLYWRRYTGKTVGVLTTTFGFVAWGAAYPADALLDHFAPGLHLQPGVDNMPIYFVALGMILILLEEQIERSKYLAQHDELTGLPNLRLLMDRLQQAFARASRAGHKVAVLLLDFDNFKEVNDNYGHRIGDLLLQQTVMRLSSRMRGTDTLSRSGGDEFTVVSDVGNRQGAEVLISALKLAVSVPFKLDGHIVRASVSIGLALYPDDGTDVDHLRAAADKAMYDAKRAGRSAVAAASIRPIT